MELSRIERCLLEAEIKFLEKFEESKMKYNSLLNKKNLSESANLKINPEYDIEMKTIHDDLNESYKQFKVLYEKAGMAKVNKPRLKFL